jgi:transposase-like protein
MESATTFCPNLTCPARGQMGEGNIRLHSRQDQRFLCTECHKTFTVTIGTAFYRLRTSAETVTFGVTLLAHGCPLQAIVVAFGVDERTVASWLARAGGQGQAVQGTWWNNRVTRGRCKPTSSASRPTRASCGWPWP